MWNWLERHLQRKLELQQGVDADLVRANRRRWRLCWSLFGLSFLLIGIQAKLRMSEPLQNVMLGLFAASFGGGLFLGHWARAERAFLNRPDPKEPPRLLKLK